MLLNAPPLLFQQQHALMLLFQHHLSLYCKHFAILCSHQAGKLAKIARKRLINAPEKSFKLFILMNSHSQ